MDEGCKLALCAECFIDNHIGHKKGRMKEVYMASKLTVNASLDSLEQSNRILEAKVKSFDEKIAE